MSSPQYGSEYPLDPQSPYPPSYGPPPGGYPPPQYPQPEYPQPGYPEPGYGYPQPGYPQPGYGYPPPAPKRSRARLWWLLGGTAALVIAGVIVTLVLTLLPDSPSDVTNKYLTAVKNHDRQAALSLYCSSLLNKAGSDDKDNYAGTGVTLKSWHITGSHESGDSAVVTVTFTFASASTGGRDKTDTQDLDLIKEGGTWKVCS